MRQCGGALHGCEECGAIADVREDFYGAENCRRVGECGSGRMC